RAGDAGERVPDRGRPALLERRPLDLVGGRGRSEEEAGGERAGHAVLLHGPCGRRAGSRSLRALPRYHHGPTPGGPGDPWRPRAPGVPVRPGPRPGRPDTGRSTRPPTLDR